MAAAVPAKQVLPFLLLQWANMFSFLAAYSKLLDNQGVKFLPRQFLFSGLSAFMVLAVLAGIRAEASAQQTSAQKRAPRTTTHQLKGSAEPSNDELATRFRAAQAATATGNPDSIIAANKKLSALALRQLGNLRLLEKAAPQAVEMLRESLALEDSPDTRMTLAIAALDANQPDETLSQTAAILAADPSNERAWFLSGKASMAKNDDKSAIVAFDHALKLRKDPNTQFSLALCYLKSNEKAQAQEIFRQMLADYGDRAIWHVIIAGAYREANLNDDAAQEFRRAIALDNTVDHAHFFLGLTLLQQNHWAQTDASMAEFRESAKLNPQDYNSNFYLGAGEAEFKQFESSNHHLSLASQEQPDAPEPWLYLGMNAFQQQDFKTAKGYLEKAIATTGSDESRNGYQLKRVYIALSRIAFTDGDRDQAQKYAQKARELQNKSLEVSGQSIAETMAEGGMGDAAAVMPHANLPRESATADSIDPTARVSTDPLKPEEAQQAKDLEARLRKLLSSSFNDWGTAEARQGMFAFALEHFQEAEKWDDSTPGLMRNVALAALKLNNQPEAERALQAAVKVDPTDTRSRAQLAMMLYSGSQYLEACSQFHALGETAYADPGMAYAWAYSLVRTKQSKQATTVLNHLVTQSLPPEILVSIGDLYAVIELYEPAIAAYRKAAGENAELPRVHYKIGAALLRLDRAAEAVNELEIELKRTPEDADVEYNLAYALLQISQGERALTLLRNVIANHPDHPQAQYQLGKALLEDGHLDDALPHLQEAAKLDPDRDYVHYQLQVAYRRLGRTVEADKELNIYREIKSQKREQAVPHPEAK